MHGHQRQIVFRRDDAVGSGGVGQPLQSGNRRIRPHQVNAHQPGEHHPGEDGNQSQAVILFADDLMVDAEYVVANEALRGRMVLDMRCLRRSSMNSPQDRTLPRHFPTRLLQCRFLFSQLSKSSRDMTCRYVFML